MQMSGSFGPSCAPWVDLFPTLPAGKLKRFHSLWSGVNTCWHRPRLGDGPEDQRFRGLQCLEGHHWLPGLWPISLHSTQWVLHEYPAECVLSWRAANSRESQTADPRSLSAPQWSAEFPTSKPTEALKLKTVRVNIFEWAFSSRFWEIALVPPRIRGGTKYMIRIKGEIREMEWNKKNLQLIFFRDKVLNNLCD